MTIIKDGNGNVISAGNPKYIKNLKDKLERAEMDLVLMVRAGRAKIWIVYIQKKIRKLKSDLKEAGCEE